MFPWDLRLHCPSVNSVNTWPPEDPKVMGMMSPPPGQSSPGRWEAVSLVTLHQDAVLRWSCVYSAVCCRGSERESIISSQRGSWEESTGQYRSSQVPSCSLRACWSFTPSKESRFLTVAYRSLPRVPSALPLTPRRSTEVKWGLHSHATHARWKRCQWALVLRPPYPRCGPHPEHLESSVQGSDLGCAQRPGLPLFSVTLTLLLPNA